MQCEPNSVALRTSVHFAAGAGGFQRKSPTGGAAYGMPRNTLTGPSLFPSTTPDAVLTCGPDDAAKRYADDLKQAIGADKVITQ